MISPVIMNVALHGMEQAAGVRYWEGGATLRAVPGTPVLVRYADDLAVLCATRAQAEQVKEQLAGVAEAEGPRVQRGQDQDRPPQPGVRLPRVHNRRYPNGKLLTKPGKEAMRRIRERLSAEAIAMRGANADALIARLNPIITGWAAYYRIGVSKRAYGALDTHLWRLAWKWAKFSHPNKPRRWIITRHFGKSTRPGRTSGCSGAGKPATTSASSPGPKSSGTGWPPGGRSRRPRPHRGLAAAATPRPPPGRPRDLAPAAPPARPVPALPVPALPGLLLHADRQPQSPEEWQQWHTVTRKAIRKHAIDSVTDLGTPDGRVAYHLIHAHCRRRIGSGTSPALLPGLQPLRACLSRAARKAGTAGSEGTPARQRAGVTRRDFPVHHPEESRLPQRLRRPGTSWPVPCLPSLTATTRPPGRSTGSSPPATSTDLLRRLSEREQPARQANLTTAA